MHEYVIAMREKRNDMQQALCRTTTHTVRSRMNECFVTGCTVRGAVWRRTNIASLARATFHGLPFPASDTSRQDALSAPFFCLLFFGKTKKSRCRPAQGRR
ncbi:hypothetical protein P3T23_004780 [Paraburkholderia sp. GAS448]